MHARRNVMLVLSIVVALAAVGFYGVQAMWWGLPLKVPITDLASVLAPLVLASTFIERATEVIISPWRDSTTNKLYAAHAAASSNAAAQPELTVATKIVLEDYKGDTTFYAFLVAFAFGLLAAMVGVRALNPFLPDHFLNGHAIPKAQQNAFILFDVVLSGALLAGGANGIHSVVNSLTTFFDTTAEKAQKSVNPPAQ